MIGISNESAPDNSKSNGRVIPADMIAPLEPQLVSLENRMEESLRGLTNCLAYDTVLESIYAEPNVGQLNAYVQQFEAGALTIGLEDISNTAKKNWDKTSNRLKELQKETIEYGRVISMGADRMFGQLESMYVQAEDIRNKPYVPTIQISGAKRFNIDGNLDINDVTRLSGLTMSTFGFYDKSFIGFMDSVIKLLSQLSFEEAFVEKVSINWATFNPTKWLVKPVPVQNDERFRVNAPLFRTPPAQGNRAIYASGPTESKTDDIKNWAFMVNMVRDMSFRYYTVRDLKPLPEKVTTVNVSPVKEIQQRIANLLNLVKQIQKRKGWESKLSNGIRKLGETGEQARNKAAAIRPAPKTETDKATSEPAKDANGAISDVVQSTSIMLNNTARIIVDYNNAMAGILRTIGALSHIAELELAAYRPPAKVADPQVPPPQQ